LGLPARTFVLALVKEIRCARNGAASESCVACSVAVGDVVRTGRSASLCIQQPRPSCSRCQRCQQREAAAARSRGRRPVAHSLIAPPRARAQPAGGRGHATPRHASTPATDFYASPRGTASRGSAASYPEMGAPTQHSWKCVGIIAPAGVSIAATPSITAGS
jgi:hypothetical protein